MSIIIACVNLKGGVGKTALAVNFAAYCGKIGKKTLLVDLDPQTNATFSCISVDVWQEHAKNHGTVANLLGARSYTNAEGTDRDVHSVIKENVFEKVDLVPSHLDLFTVDLDLASATARETRLRKALLPVLDQYQVMVCDCPPNLTLPTQNALALSSHFVVPISPDFLSSLGVALLLTRVRRFSEELGHDLKLAGMVITRVGRPATHRLETVAALREQFKDVVLKNQITERTVVSEAAAKNKPIYSMGNSLAADEFAAVSKELLERMGVST